MYEQTFFHIFLSFVSSIIYHITKFINFVQLISKIPYNEAFYSYIITFVIY